VLKPPLRGYRLRPGRAQYARIEPEADGSVLSEQLGLKLWLDEQLRLHCTDPVTGQTLLRPSEARCEGRAAARRAGEEKRRADAAERELARLRAELAKRGRRPQP